MNADILVYHAKSFYNAYIALEQLDRQRGDPLLFVPVIVNGAFSIEITLKAILAKNQIEYGKEHNLLVLFRLLPEPFQFELLDHFFEKAPEYKDNDRFANELILISNAFVDWRYMFEGNPAPALETRFLAAFANAAIWTMFSHYNVDLVPSTDKTKTDEEIERLFEENREECKEINLNKIRKILQKQNRG